MLFMTASVVAMAAAAAAKTVTYEWDLSWVKANPDGLFERDVVGINGAWPLPIVNVTKGDRLVVTMNNKLDVSSSIHWHGMFQNGTNYMDGPSMVTQCPVPPGSSFTYNFTVDQNGTYWYHCHTDFCYPDGYRQALLVQDDQAPFKYDKEISITLSDWYHDLQKVLSKQFMSLYNPTGAEPVPNSFLLNEGLNQKIAVEPGKTYLLRIINIAAFVSQFFWIEGVNMTIVEVDGVYVEPKSADKIYLSVAQRYSVLLTTPNTTAANLAMVMVADSDLLDTIPSDLQLNSTHWLVLNESAPMDQVAMTVDLSNELIPVDDIDLVPTDGQALFENPDIVVNVTVFMINLINGYNYAFFNNITYTAPKVPSLYSVLSAPDNATASSSVVYGEYTNPFVLKKNQVVEIVINNGDTGTHPFHLHGHTFQVINRSPPYGADYNAYKDGDPVYYDASNHSDFPTIPVRRDTVVLPPQGYVVLRFIADNPGVWIFHCHIDWHLSSGLALIFVEAPDELRAQTTIPDQHYSVCAAASVPTVGNAAANSANFLDLKGQNKQQKSIPGGFTPRGETAMAFCVLSAVLGITALVFYGLADLKHRPTDPPTPQQHNGSDDVVAAKSG